MKNVVSIGSVLICSVVAYGSAIVYPNNPPGDSFTNPGPTNQGQAVGSSGWYYNNVRNGGTVGINPMLPYATTGSVYFYSPSGSGKADIEYLASAVEVGGNYVASGSLGLFSNLQSLSYAWYRDGSTTVAAHLHPVLRILLDADGDLSTLGDRGGLVFERVYNGAPTAPTNAWVSEGVGPSTFLWNFGLGIGFAANINDTPYAYDATLAEWQAYFPNAVILGFNAGVGSGWNGVFAGAVDSVSWTIAGQSESFNFEIGPGAEIPEPGTWLLFGGGLLALRLRARRAG